MILARVIRDLFQRRDSVAAVPDGGSRISAMGNGAPSVLNVSGGSRRIPIPEHYAGWNHLLLDIDIAGKPDLLCDARQLSGLVAEQFDAVYCSHNLEHYYKHEVANVLQGFRHVPKSMGLPRSACQISTAL